MSITTLCASVLLSMGGSVGLLIILLRFAKSRFEQYVDAFISSRFEREIEKLKFELEKRLTDYNSLSEKYSQCESKLIDLMDVINKSVSIIEEGIKRCAEEHKTLHFMFSSDSYAKSIGSLRDAIRELNSSFFQMYLPKDIFPKLVMLSEQCSCFLNALNAYEKDFKFETSEYNDLLEELLRVKLMFNDFMTNFSNIRKASIGN